MKFSKPPKSYLEQISLLRNRRLLINDEAEAKNVLMNVNYYRLSAYYIPFQDTKDLFNKGTTFDQIFSLYKFDRNLRLLVLDIIELIEISLRAKLSYLLAQKYGPFGYLKRKIYERSFHYQDWIEKLAWNIGKSHEVFIKEYFGKYEDRSLPIWMAIEIISFGELSILYKHLLLQDRQKIARTYYNIDQKALVSWFHSLVYIRNLCAHHSRLWNRNLSIAPRILRTSIEWSGIDNRKIFSVMLMCKTLCPDSSYWDKWLEKLRNLFDKYNPDISQMGFPDNWQKMLEIES